ncbi:MAG TPA: DUF4276 family protein [Gemmataceae bacterium]|jgi:hypothetical protein|nr:DUF4276 family protein [Gemmataceae bacterium]
MVRLYFYVEGQTEQEYAERVLRPHLAGVGVQVMGAVLAASGRKHGQVFRGGGRRYQPMRKDLGNLLRQDARADARFTTMFDLYALHDGFPGWDEAEKQRRIPQERVLTLERAFAADVGDHRFIPHIQLYEFETILLCEPSHFALVYEDSGAGIAALQAAVAAAASPELVNDGETTAPSKRILSQFPQYSGQKTTVGVELAHCVGIDTTRSLCAHFDRWLKTLESLGCPPAGGTPA